MELRELNRMFDQLAPTAEQEQAVLDRLLAAEEREVFPMRKLRKLTVLAVAAALMVISCAAAVITGIDQRLIDYLGGGEQAQELLAPGAAALNISVMDQGAVLQVDQLLMDRFSILVLAEFTAPEGTVLDETSTGLRFDTGCHRLRFFDSDGAELNINTSYGQGWTVLADGDPADGHLSLLYRLNVTENARLDQAASFMLDAKDLIYFDRERPLESEKVVLYSGDWSVQVPLPEKDIGWVQKTDDPIVKEIYLSPMSVQLSMSLEDLRKERVDEQVTLTSQDGQLLTALRVFGGGTGTGVGDLSGQRQDVTFQLAEIADPAQFQGGTLTVTIGEDRVDIPLDGLTPAE